MKKNLVTALTLILLFFSFAKTAQGQGISLIRDAQTEKFLWDLSKPIFLAANLKPENIKIYIVNDNSINAFVSGGQNVFINTGLIQKYSTPDALIGVVAHETGHIAAGHLARSGEASQEAQGAMILSYLLGASAIAAGSPDAGIALITGGSQTAQRLYLKYTRQQEEAADNHAIDYLEKISYPADGLVKLLSFFQSQMLGYKGQIDEYLLSHPISSKRIDVIKARTAKQNFSNKKINAQLQSDMNIVLAKLEAFTEKPEILLKNLEGKNDEISNYKKSIALFRQGQISQAVKILDQIISPNFNSNSSTKNSTISVKNSLTQLGFLYELRGQFFFESGNNSEAVASYKKAIKLLNEKDAVLAKIYFASAILNLVDHDSELLEIAIKNLNEAKNFEDENPFIFKQLAKAYAKDDSKNGNLGRSYLALAEYSFLINDQKNAKKYLKQAKENLPKDAKSENLRADDLKELMKSEKKDDKDDKDEKDDSKPIIQKRLQRYN